jgi:hypothetical protein
LASSPRGETFNGLKAALSIGCPAKGWRSGNRLKIGGIRRTALPNVVSVTATLLENRGKSVQAQVAALLTDCLAFIGLV